MRKFEIDGDGTRLHLREYLPEGDAAAVIQLIHGMEEHQGRYVELAEYLSSRGFTVVTSDMRGHGAALPTGELGWFDDRDGWKLLLDDALRIRDEIGRLYPELPVYLVAHSMGSMIARVLMKTESKRWSRVILLGYPNCNRSAGFGIALANGIQRVKGARYKSKLLRFMARTTFNGRLCRASEAYDWISFNRENVERFNADPLCGFGFTVSAMRDLFELNRAMHESEGCENVAKKLPILLLSGESDACVGGASGRRDSYDALRRQGFTRLTVMTLPARRHEILHEARADEVYRIIGDFLEY